MSKYGEEYETFITACKSLVARKSVQLDRRNTETLREAARKVCDRLKETEAVRAVEEAFGNLDEVVRETFYLELQYVNANLAEGGNDNQRDIDDAKTAKDSLEELLGSWLPEWIKKSLTVLNEILSLAH